MRGNTVDPLQPPHRIGQPAFGWIGQIHLVWVAAHHHAASLAETGEEHLHLQRRGILGFIEDHEGLGQGAPAHEGERCNLDLARRQPTLHLFRGQHVIQGIIERPQIGIDLLAHVARQKAEPLACLHRRS